MPHPGHSPLGAELYKQHQKTSHVNVDRINFKRGILYKSVSGTYIFTIRLLENNKVIGPLPLQGSPDELAMRYGSPSEMEGKWEVQIVYKGSSINRGMVNIVSEINASITSSKESADQSNQLKVKGTAFAPPGPGM
jgi:hypothetical protein